MGFQMIWCLQSQGTCIKKLESPVWFFPGVTAPPVAHCVDSDRRPPLRCCQISLPSERTWAKGGSWGPQATLFNNPASVLPLSVEKAGLKPLVISASCKFRTHRQTQHVVHDSLTAFHSDAAKVTFQSPSMNFNLSAEDLAAYTMTGSQRNCFIYSFSCNMHVSCRLQQGQGKSTLIDEQFSLRECAGFQRLALESFLMSSASFLLDIGRVRRVRNE